MSRGASMEAINLDDEWELLPDHKNSFVEECNNGGHGAVGGGKDQLLLGARLVMINMDHFGGPTSHPRPCDCILDEEAKKPPLPPLQDAHGRDPVAEFKDIGVVPAKTEREELVGKVTEIVIYEAEEQDQMTKARAGVKEVDQDEVVVEAAPDGQCAQEEGGVRRVGFSVGNLRVHGVGALCSFGVAAATFCILLLGGKQQQQQQLKSQNHKIQLQMYADDERIQQVVQQASRLNQTMSSVMGGASSTRASISFGGHYHGF